MIYLKVTLSLVPTDFHSIKCPRVLIMIKTKIVKVQSNTHKKKYMHAPWGR